MNLFNDMVSWFIRRRVDLINEQKAKPIETQQRMLQYLVDMGSNTEWGKHYKLWEVKNYQDYKNRFPIQDYDTLKPYIERVMDGEQFLLWPTKVNWFAKSSGTTSDKSKFIPVSRESLEDCHFRGGKDAMTLYCYQRPDTKVFTGKGLIMGGSNRVNQLNPDSFYGDVSAVMLQNLPFIAEYFRTPELCIALMDEWEEKIDKMARSTMKDNVTHIGGVPSWTLVLIRKILDLSGETDLKNIWPNLEVFMHGGVSFKPYRDQYAQVLPDGSVNFVETYNASEGFIALQDELGRDDMLLMLDYGTFYEFIPIEHAHEENPDTISLEDIEIGKQYAMVVTTNAGLWRYKIGDTVRFTTTYPFRIQISGRVKHFINAFGEEVVVDNTDKALADACAQHNAQVREYTAAPEFIGEGRGYHKWLIEFERTPDSLDAFSRTLDESLQKLNSDYEAKRYKNMVLKPLQLTIVPEGTFYNWLKRKGKLGGQHKVPRLSNEDEYIAEILAEQPVSS